MNWRDFLARTWWIGLLGVVLVSGVFYLLIGRGFRTSFKDQIYLQQTIIARASASNIQSVIGVIGNSISLLAQSSDIRLKNATTQNAMDAFVDQWMDNGLIGGVILTDSSGVVVFNSNISGTYDTGDSVADRDYFLWASNQKKEGTIFVGEPVVSRLGASEGQTIVTVSSPVLVNGIFSGVVTTSVKLHPLTERYLNLMKVEEESRVYLIDSSKATLYQNDTLPLSETVRNSVEVGKEGRLESAGKLIVYSPVNLSNQKWEVIVTTPNHLILTNTIPFHIRQAVVLVLMAVVTLGFGKVAYQETLKHQNRL